MKSFFLNAFFAVLLCTGTFVESQTMSRILCDNCGADGEANAFVVMTIAG